MKFQDRFEVGNKVYWIDPNAGSKPGLSGIYIVEESGGIYDTIIIKADGSDNKISVYWEDLRNIDNFSIEIREEPDYGEDKPKPRFCFNILDRGWTIDGNNGYLSKEEAYIGAVGALGYLLK